MDCKKGRWRTGFFMAWLDVPPSKIRNPGNALSFGGSNRNSDQLSIKRWLYQQPTDQAAKPVQKAVENLSTEP